MIRGVALLLVLAACHATAPAAAPVARLPPLAPIGPCTPETDAQATRAALAVLRKKVHDATGHNVSVHFSRRNDEGMESEENGNMSRAEQGAIDALLEAGTLPEDVTVLVDHGNGTVLFHGLDEGYGTEGSSWTALAVRADCRWQDLGMDFLVPTESRTPAGDALFAVHEDGQCGTSVKLYRLRGTKPEPVGEYGYTFDPNVCDAPPSKVEFDEDDHVLKGMRMLRRGRDAESWVLEETVGWNGDRYVISR